MTRAALLAAVALSAGIAHGPAGAQTVVGRSVVDGEVVILLSDGTWTPEAPDAAQPCVAVATGVSFCGDARTWVPQVPPNREIAAQYRRGDTIYVQVISEAIGSDGGMSPAAMRRAVLTNARTAEGSVGKVPVLGVGECAVDGHGGERIDYRVTIDGLRVVFSNCMVIQPARSSQFIAYEIGQIEVTEDLDRARAAFLDLLRLPKAKP